MRRFSFLAVGVVAILATQAFGQGSSRLPQNFPSTLPPVNVPATPELAPTPNYIPLAPAPALPALPVVDCPPGYNGPLPLVPPSLMPQTPPVNGLNGMNGQPLSAPAQEAVQSATSPFAQSTEAGGLASRTFDNAMFGDFGGVFYRRNEFFVRPVQVGTTQRQVGTDPLTRQPILQEVPVMENRTVAKAVNLPLNGRYSGFKMSDQEGPRPTDRIYFAYSYYGNVNPGQNPGIGNVDQHRQTIGFEKTILNGNASIGLRLPFVQTVGEGSLDSSNIGDLSVSLKYAFVNDPFTGSVRSAGLIITAPTGSATATLVDGTQAAHGTILQPWTGFSQQLGQRLYAQGFSSVMVPLNTSEPTILFNSLSMGYWLLRSGEGERFKGLAPVTEIHINTPLTNRDPSNAIYIQDQINLTHGLHLMLPRASIGAAFSYPLISPRPFAGEGLFTLNFRF